MNRSLKLVRPNIEAETDRAKRTIEVGIDACIKAVVNCGRVQPQMIIILEWIDETRIADQTARAGRNADRAGEIVMEEILVFGGSPRVTGATDKHGRLVGHRAF
jgi:hypothetical protein